MERVLRWWLGLSRSTRELCAMTGLSVLVVVDNFSGAKKGSRLQVHTESANAEGTAHWTHLRRRSSLIAPCFSLTDHLELGEWGAYEGCGDDVPTPNAG